MTKAPLDLEEISSGGSDSDAEVLDAVQRAAVGEQGELLETLIRAVPDLLGAIPDIIVLKDPDGRWLQVNEFTRELFNLDGDTYRLKTDVELAQSSKFHRAAHLECARTDRIAWERGELSVQEEQIPTADGQGTRIFETMKVPMYHEDGTRKALMVLGRDISARRRADHQNRRLGRILDDSYNEIFTIDAETMRFVQVNRGARLNLGYTAEEMAQMTPMDVTPMSEETLRSLVRPLMDGSEPLLTFETTHRRKNGSTYPVEVRLLLSHTEPRRVFVAIALDISQRKRADRIKDEFISVVSHELRTPLTPIIGVLELLGASPKKLDDERTAQMIAVAHRNAMRLRRLIDQLLDYRELSTGHASFQMEDLELGELVRTAVSGNEFLRERYDYELDFQPAPDELWVNADRRYLSQVLAILLSNAAKFSPDGATVRVALSVSDGAARIEVSDQGPGVPEELHDQIFEHFVQADSTSTRAHGGAGLGLALARVIVENFSGRIFFEAADHGGTTFYVELPLVDR